MKKTLTLALAAMFGISISQADIIYPDGSKPAPEPMALKKLSRGFANTVFAPLEIPRSVFEIGHDQGVLSTEQISLGLILRGPYRAAIRGAAGFYDIGTFWKDDTSLLHLDPEILNATDALPGFPQMFNWEAVDGVKDR